MALFGRGQSLTGMELVATFTGRASPEVAMECFGYLMAKLKLWGELKDEADVARHNAAVEILRDMRAGPSVNLRNMEKLGFLIEHERPEDAT